MKYFVYGTLMSGEPNNSVLGDAKLVERVDTVKGKLYDVHGAYPAFKQGEGRVQGEVWETTDLHTQVNLDALEGVPTLYDKKVIRTDKGHECIIYVYQHDVSYLPRILTGSWRAAVKVSA